MSDQAQLRIGVLGAAKISKKALFAPASEIADVEVVAIAARDRQRAEDQAAEHGIDRVLDSYEQVLAADDVEAIYNPLPISLHHEWTIAALRAGKHVLCEKPLASNAAEAAEIVTVANETGLSMVEAFHWRYHPMADRIRSLLDAGAVGEIRRIDARFNVPIPESDDVRQSWELSGGALMDLGCYPVQWARFVAGSEPTVLAASMIQGRENVDVRTELSLEFASPEGGQPIAGHVVTSMEQGVTRDASLTIEGSDGVMEVTNPIAPHMGNRLVVTPHADGAGNDDQSIDEEVGGESTYHHQMLAFRDLLRDGTPVPTGGDDSIATMRVIDSAYEAGGLTPRGS